MEFHLIQAGIPKKDIDEMTEKEVIRKWTVASVLMEEVQKKGGTHKF